MDSYTTAEKIALVKKETDAIILNPLSTSEEIDDAKKLNDTEKAKITISNDAFAISEFLDFLIKKFEHTRLSLMK